MEEKRGMGWGISLPSNDNPHKKTPTVKYFFFQITLVLTLTMPVRAIDALRHFEIG